MKRGIYAVMMACLTASVQTLCLADEYERVVWDKKPIPISLVKGHERMVSFPGDVEVGVPQQLAQKLRTQSANNTIYWLANDVFDAQRIQVRDINTGHMYLIDLRSVDQQNGEYSPLQVIEPKQDSSAGDALVTRGDEDDSKEIGLVALTRFASQQLYAPRRLINGLPGVHRVAISEGKMLPLYQGGELDCVPLIGWKSGRYYVTAVKLRNTTKNPVALDPKKIRGDWQAATFQHNNLGPSNSGDSTTTAYLVSTRSFEDALGPWLLGSMAQ